MRIVPPSATIIEKELAGLSVCQRIDRCASVCYQRPPKPTEEDAEQFCRSLIERGHLPALEVAVVHLVMREDADFPVSDYLHYLPDEDKETLLISGSIRAFMEAKYAQDAANLLSLKYPTFFKRNYIEYPPAARFATTAEIPWQHRHVAVRVICSRAISHQLVRHRPCSFLQESARFCKYDDGVTFIRPEWAVDGGKSDIFLSSCFLSERMYQVRRENGLSPQQARGGLIHDVKTELIMHASLPEWLHIFKMRCAKAADPEMRRIIVPLREQFRAEYPEMWGEK